MPADPQHDYVSRGGIKLAAALDAFSIDPSGLACADLGANVGGFTDVLLRRGAARVYAVDTGYGTLAWKLRSDARVVVMERANAMHVEPTAVELVVIDLGWTRQRHAIPAALRWSPRQIVTLIKPHYESERRGVLDVSEAAAIAERVLGEMVSMGVRVMGSMVSPIRGGASRSGGDGNVEYLAHLRVE